jgi:hypothetical protein
MSLATPIVTPMKQGLKDIIGKRIATVVVAQSDRPPRQQVFLAFPDGNCLELYGESFNCCAGLDRADRIAHYVESGGGRVANVYGDASILEPRPSAPGSNDGSLETLLRRDLDAWVQAKAAVEKARRA